MENIAENKKCKNCSANFTVSYSDLEFYYSVSPMIAWELFRIPSPNFCPDCRHQRRLTFRNESKLFNRPGEITWKNIVVMYPPWTSFKVYNADLWFSDKWDPLSYWKKINTKESFFKQFWELLKIVPRLWRNVFNVINSDYTNNCSNISDCYLSFNWWDSKKVLYSNLFRWCYSVLDSRKILDSNNCYESINCDKCYNLMYWENCVWVEDSRYMKACSWCNYCFWCVNLVNKKYCIENVQYTREEYFEILPVFRKNYSREKFQEFCSKHFVKALQNYNSKNVIWNNIYNSKNVFHSYNINASENIKYSYDLRWINSNIMDVNEFWWNIEYCLDSCTIWHDSSFLLFCNLTYDNCYNLMYCDSCFNCKNCFWCSWLKNKEYCIMNIQYDEESYKETVSKIIKTMIKLWEWWEFFPSSISPFWYNHTLANWYFPLSKSEALQKWFNWSDYILPIPKVDKIIPANKLPDDIKDIPDDILNRAIECEVSKKPFRIVAHELDFYRKNNLPIPKKHPWVRFEERMKIRNKRKIYERKCDKCSRHIITIYPDTRPEKVYCEECYDKEVGS